MDVTCNRYTGNYYVYSIAAKTFENGQSISIEQIQENNGYRFPNNYDAVLYCTGKHQFRNSTQYLTT